MDASKRAGGLARSEKLTPERRREIAKAAAAKRWAGHVALPAGLRRPPWLSEPLWAFVLERAAQKHIEPMAWLARCVAKAKKDLEAEAAPPSRLKKR